MSPEGATRPPPSVRDAAALYVAVIVGLVGAGKLWPNAGLPGLAAAEVVFVAVPVVLVALVKRASLGITLPKPAHALGGLLVGSSLWVVVAALWLPIQERIAPTPKDLERALERIARPDDQPLAVVLVAVALVPAVAEELLCRAALCRSLAARWGNRVAVIASAFLFAALHGSPYRLVPQLVLGLALGAMTLRAGSVIPAMLAHAANNAGLIVVSGSTLQPWLEAHPATAFAAAVGLVTIGHALFLLRSRAGG